MIKVKEITDKSILDSMLFTIPLLDRKHLVVIQDGLLYMRVSDSKIIEWRYEFGNKYIPSTIIESKELERKYKIMMREEKLKRILNY